MITFVSFDDEISAQRKPFVDFYACLTWPETFGNAYSKTDQDPAGAHTLKNINRHTPQRFPVTVRPGKISYTAISMDRLVAKE